MSARGVTGHGNLPVLRSSARYAGITAIVLAVFACVLLLAGKNPIKAYVDTFRYTLANAYGFSELLVRMTPLLLTASAATPNSPHPTPAWPRSSGRTDCTTR